MPANILTDLPDIITAVGALGTAAFGLVESTKAFRGGVNHFGFNGIGQTVAALTPDTPGGPAALTRARIIDILRAHWFNGTKLESQKAIAKSLIKLNLTPATVAHLAGATGMSAEALGRVAQGMAAGRALDEAEADTLARFDLTVTALLDDAYERGDQAFKSRTKAVAMLIAVVLAIAGGWVITGTPFMNAESYGEAIIIGLLATPIAPIAKDLATALASAANAMQVVRR